MKEKYTGGKKKECIEIRINKKKENKKKEKEDVRKFLTSYFFLESSC
jgi:hypothetical protein